RVGEVLAVGIVCQQTQAVGVTAANVDIARVVPAARRILQQVDRAHRKGRIQDGDVGRKYRAVHEARGLVWPPRLNQAGPGKHIVDEVSPLQVQAAVSQIADLQDR